VRLRFENIDLKSTSGPNHFGKKLYNQLIKNKSVFFDGTPDISLCFIESHRPDPFDIPVVQRLDGIYFNTKQNSAFQNLNIQRTYDEASGVVLQSYFDKQLVFKYFGEHKNYKVIHNGADIEYIDQIQPLKNKSLDKFENVWSCASSWRPHKRLRDNISYFLEHSGEKDCLVVAGDYSEEDPISNDRIFFTGNLDVQNLTALYKRSKYFIHLAWLDHCPNVVVDAQGSGCQIICSSAGGTREVAGSDAIVIEEEEWDFQPVDLYSPPKLDFSKKIENNWNMVINMEEVAKRYYYFLNKTMHIELDTSEKLKSSVKKNLLPPVQTSNIELEK